VINACPVVPAAKLASLKGRFARGEAGVEGAGLGLAIVDAIASGAGATLDLRSPATGRSDGFEAVLTLPGAEHR
jgi:two-component system OmpR family sensor kinase